MDKVVHFEIPFKKHDRASKFYSGLFGWKMNPVPEMDYTIVHTVEVDSNNMPKESGAINGGLTKSDKKTKSPVLVIDVPSIDAYVEKIKKAGGKIVQKKMAVGDMGYYAKFKDSEGNILGIWENIKK